MSSPRIEFGQQVYQHFLDKGLPPAQAAAIAGNMAWEGGGKANLVNPGDNWRHSPSAPHSIGVGQWNDRSQGLVNYARSQGIEIPQGDLRDPRYAQDVINRIPLKTQLDFAWNEMQGPEGAAYARIRGAGDDLRAATAGAIGYHRPAGWSAGNPTAGHGFEGRLALAQQIAQAGSPQPASLGPNSVDDKGAVAPTQLAMLPTAPAATPGSVPLGFPDMAAARAGAPAPVSDPVAAYQAEIEDQQAQAVQKAQFASLLGEDTAMQIPKPSPARIRTALAQRSALGFRS